MIGSWLVIRLLKMWAMQAGEKSWYNPLKEARLSNGLFPVGTKLGKVAELVEGTTLLTWQGLIALAGSNPALSA